MRRIDNSSGFSAIQALSAYQTHSCAVAAARLRYAPSKLEPVVKPRRTAGRPVVCGLASPLLTPCRSATVFTASAKMAMEAKKKNEELEEEMRALKMEMNEMKRTSKGTYARGAKRPRGGVFTHRCFVRFI